MAIQQILRSTFGYDAFRPGQEAIIQSVLARRDTLALLPTGGGKSVCYQVPALAMEGLCIVVTPLIALMKDQVRQLHRRNVSALAIHSGLQFFEVKKALENAASGHFRFLYMSPERLQSQLFLEYLPALPLNLIAVDEAHCISQWGYDFRPAYLQIASLRTEKPDVPILALTASATPRVQQDIMQQLQFGEDAAVFRQSFLRPNLSFSAFCLPQKANKMVEVLQKVPGCALVYCRNRRRTSEIASLLKMHGMAADFYHAGLSSEERNNRQDAWMNNHTRVMVCTNAFGMGIDKPDVRLVIHADVPESLEAYYQEAGRAGRDGKKSYAVLLFNQDDISGLEALADRKFPPLPVIRDIYQKMAHFLQVPAGSGGEQYYNFDLAQFINRFGVDAVLALNALQYLQTAGYVSFQEQVFLPSRVQVTASRSLLEQTEQLLPGCQPLLQQLLRSYGGILDFPVSISEKMLAKHLRCTADEVSEGLQRLVTHRIIEYQPRKDTPQLYFMYDRVPADQLFLDEKQYRERKKIFQQQVAAVMAYAESVSGCRSTMIRRYFGDEEPGDCGICDHCLAAAKPPIREADIRLAETRIVSVLTRNMTVPEIKKCCAPMDAALLDIALQRLQEEEKIWQRSDGSFDPA